MSVRVIEGDMVEVLAGLEAESFHACVTDPPYHFGSIIKRFAKTGGGDRTASRVGAYTRHAKGFMGKSWDGGDVAFRSETWAQVIRVLKPGAHLVAFGGTKGFHRMACAIEDAGFEIRDTLCWLYGGGFPKSHNQDGEWEGWGTALKPAYEPIVLARKPLIGSVAANLAEHRTGAMNIKGCRIEYASKDDAAAAAEQRSRQTDRSFDGWGMRAQELKAEDWLNGNLGRWPANVLHDGSEEVVAGFPDQVSGGTPPSRPRDKTRNTYGAFGGEENPDGIGSTSGNASRFFYCAKADREERNIGLDGFEEKPLLWSSGEQSPGTFQAPNTKRAAQNNHPTVKPVSLMQWLVRLVTPKGGVVLDPFMGSGSTGIACSREGFDFVGIEQDAAYAAIARARLKGDAPLLVDVT